MIHYIFQYIKKNNSSKFIPFRLIRRIRPPSSSYYLSRRWYFSTRFKLRKSSIQPTFINFNRQTNIYLFTTFISRINYRILYIVYLNIVIYLHFNYIAVNYFQFFWSSSSTKPNHHNYPPLNFASKHTHQIHHKPPNVLAPCHFHRNQRQS